MAWVQYSAFQDFSLFHSIQIDSVAHTASCPMGMGGRALSPGVKWAGHEADYSPPSRAEVKKVGDVPPLCHVYVFMALCLTN
jgi:hypothetical protein